MRQGFLFRCGFGDPPQADLASVRGRQRAPEIGIRTALGADRRGAITMVMRGAIIQTMLGLTIGIPVALLCVRFVKAQLYEITRADAGVMTGATVTLAVAACVGGIVPARRAASLDPAQALRTE